METQTLTTNKTIEYSPNLYNVMVENGDSGNAEKIADIYEKWKKNEFVISFAGHFSAGKSSMINALLEKSVLPKSPIPTSANVVKIKSGNGTARIYFHDQQPLEYDEPYDIDMIKEYAKDKASIKEIEINTNEKLLPENCMLIDTPGIDAADDADRIITESSLHLVDYLFYVMDYNHVQSEVNLQFLQKIQGYDIPFYILINQIDKHDEHEIPFTTFEKNIRNTFEQWSIFPEQIYYSSLKDNNAAHNQFPEIKETLLQLMMSAKTSAYVERSIHQIIHEHKHYLSNWYENELADLKDENDSLNSAEELHAVNEKIGNLQQLPQKLEKDFYDQLNTTLKNAYLMPADLRDKAKLFLESQQKDFKVGLFATKRKTEEERTNRLNSFLNALQTQAESSVQWKLRDKLLGLLREYQVAHQNLVQQVQELFIHYDEKMLTGLIKSGAKLSGDYVLNFTNDVSAAIKQQYKQEALTLLHAVKDQLNEDVSNQLNHYKEDQKRLEHVYEIEQTKEMLKESLETKYQQIQNALYELPSKENEHILLERIEANKGNVAKASMDTRVKETKKHVFEKQEKLTGEKLNTNASANDVLEDIKTAASAMDSLSIVQSVKADLDQKFSRLQNRRYTIALFGAFSAGKSSFANALIGENVLPVSPNPTTAVINRINPITASNKHGEIIVTVKDEETLVHDILLLTKHIAPKTNDFHELLAWLRKMDLTAVDKLSKTHQAYLHAIIQGYDVMKNNLAGEITIDMADFAGYVTDETKACFIESVDLYYDCPLTKEGITLVDTPGADSVNARHTNVAFEYIKHADAILYVTYYNHALSRADKDFLMQLGRVKDAFELDKMFFMMNAADLAEDQDELNLVLNYVEEQLAGLGIRLPRLYPISSKQSLKEKKNGRPLNKNMAVFEQDFSHFVHYELTHLTNQAVYRDIARAAQLIEDYLYTLKLDDSQKAVYRENLLTKQKKLEKYITDINPAIYQERINQKLEKQLFYVQERVAIRFHDFFKETFNPATITQSGKEAQDQLKSCLQELLDYTGYELMQELRAVSIRMEAFIKQIVHEISAEFSVESKKIDDGFTLPDLDEIDMESADFNQAFEDIDLHVFEKVLKQFNGTKRFFAKNEKETMRDNLYNLLKPYIESYMHENQSVMNKLYEQQWTEISQNIKNKFSDYVKTYINSHLSMITDKNVDKALLEEKQQLLRSLADPTDEKGA